MSVQPLRKNGDTHKVNSRFSRMARYNKMARYMGEPKMMEAMQIHFT